MRSGRALVSASRWESGLTASTSNNDQPENDPFGLYIYAGQLLDRAERALGPSDEHYRGLVNAEIAQLNDARSKSELQRRAFMKASRRSVEAAAQKLEAEATDVPVAQKHARAMEMRVQDRLDREQTKSWVGLVGSLALATATVVLTATIWDSEKVILSVVSGILGASGLGGAGFLGGKSVTSLAGARKAITGK